MVQPRSPSPLEREQWLLGEQTEAARTRTEASLDEQARARLLEEDAALRARLFAALPPERLAARAALRATAARRARVPPLPLAAALIAACALLVVVRSSHEQTEHAARAPVTERAKGDDLELRVYRSERDGKVERLAEGAEASVHDVLQLGLKRSGHPYGVLLSIDGRGTVTLHYPTAAGGTSALPSEGGEVLLPSAYELDDAPAFERFILVAAHEPLDVEEVLAAARTLATEPAHAQRDPLLLRVRSTQRSVLLVKREAR